MELNTSQLIKILQADPQVKVCFLGVFARDQLPLRIKFPSCFVVNTDKSNERGEHWLAFYYDKNKKLDFFDSYGNHPEFFKLEKYVKQTSTSFNFNSQQLQSFSSKICGYYCIFFLLHRARNVPMGEFLAKFSRHDLINDLALLNLISK